jgi:hypothetical protein
MKFTSSAVSLLSSVVLIHVIPTANGRPGRPCGVVVGPDDNPGATRRSSKARANFDALPLDCDEQDAITIELPDGRSKIFGRARSTPPGRGRENSPAYWFGQDELGDPLNYVRGKNGTIAGSFVDMAASQVFQFGTGADGSPTIVITATEDFPPEGDAVMPGSGGRALQVEEESTTPTRPDSTNVLRGMTRSQDQPGRRLGDDLGGNLDVMVVWTKKAECKNIGLSDSCQLSAVSTNAMIDRIELAVAETNTAFIASGVNTMLNLVHSYREESYVEASTNAFGVALSHIKGTSDGVMDNVHALRDQYGADIVAMIIDDPQYCGIAYLGPKVELMFSVTAWNCATGYFSFGHEIG